MDTEKPMVPDTGDLSQLLEGLRRVGQKPDRTLLDRVKAHGQAAIRPLIEMAVDDKLHSAHSDSPEVWAPLHAIQLLGELAATEAVEPLLPLFDWVDDDYLAQTLPEAFGGIGAPGVAPLRALLFDRSRDVWARVRAAESLGKIGQKHPETRSEVVRALVARLDPAESQVPEDEILNAFVIRELLDLQADEAAPAIRQAFDEDRVDTSIADLDDVLERLDRPSGRRRKASRPPAGLRLQLRCKACGSERPHDVATVYYDPEAAERRQQDDEPRDSDFVIPQRIICPKCGAVDQYDLSTMASAALTAELLKQVLAGKGRASGVEPEAGPSKLVEFRLADGRRMHPSEARDMYRREVEAKPDHPELRVRYANVLRFLGYRDEAIEQYRAALRLDPANLEASLNLGRLARASGDRAEAHRMFESVIAQAPNSHLPRKDREAYVEATAHELAELARPPEGSAEARLLARLRQQEPPEARGPGAATPRPGIQAVRKVGCNDPCPGGSGKKYKKCHGR